MFPANDTMQACQGLLSHILMTWNNISGGSMRFIALQYLKLTVRSSHRDRHRILLLTPRYCLESKVNPINQAWFHILLLTPQFCLIIKVVPSARALILPQIRQMCHVNRVKDPQRIFVAPLTTNEAWQMRLVVLSHTLRLPSSRNQLSQLTPSHMNNHSSKSAISFRPSRKYWTH